MFGVRLNSQNAASSKTQAPFSHRTDQVLLHPSSAVGGHDDEVRFYRVCVVCYRFPGLACLDMDLNSMKRAPFIASCHLSKAPLRFSENQYSDFRS